MRTSFSLLLSCLTLAITAVSASPSSDLSSSSSSTKPTVNGAIYFLTNNPKGNDIVCYTIGKGGQLTFAGLTHAGGVGLDGIDDPPPQIADAVYTQNVILVEGNYLYTTNPGSNTVVMFSINPRDPSKLTMIGKPIYSGGDWPTSVGVSPTTGDLCVINSGKLNAVQCYYVSKSRGLTPIPGGHFVTDLNQTSPPTGPPNTFSQILFSDDGKHLLAAYKGNIGIPGWMQTWDVSPTGALSRKTIKSFVTEPGLLPFGTRSVVGFKDVYINADLFTGTGIYDYRGGYDKPAKVNVYSVPTGIGPCWVVWSPKTGNYYLSDFRTPSVWEVHVNPDLTVTNVKDNVVTQGGVLIDFNIASVGKNDYLYVHNAGLMQIIAYSINAVANISTIQTFEYVQNVQRAGGVADGNYTQGMATYVVPGAF